MSTHASISVKSGDHIRTIYCQNDGYLEHTGAILLKHYNSKKKAEGLVDHGDASCINEVIGERIDNHRCVNDFVYYSKVRKQCRFYHRDYDEALSILEDMNKKELRDYMQYNYLYEDGAWYVSCHDTGYKWELLFIALANVAVSEKAAS